MTTATAETPLEDLTQDSLYASDDALDPGAATAGGPIGPDTITPEAPYGYTQDRVTKEWRPKKAPGRPHTPKDAEQLAAGPPPPPPPADEPPRTDVKPPPPADEDVPMPKGGTIAKAVDKLYRRAGRIMRHLDRDIGEALIACTHADEEDDITAGQAWEALCRTNPRIRAWVLQFTKGGAWQDLLMVHAPIAIAILSKPWILSHIPFMSIIGEWFAGDDDGQADDDDGGQLEPGDLEQIADTHSAVMQRAGAGVTLQRIAAKLADGSARPEDLDQLDPDLVAAAQAMAAKGVPPGFRRQQPKNRTRAKRRH